MHFWHQGHEQIHIPIWSDLNQFHHPQTDKLKTACNLSDMRTTPLLCDPLCTNWQAPWARCARDMSTDRPSDKTPYHPRPSQTLQPRRFPSLRPGPWPAAAAAGSPVGP